MSDARRTRRRPAMSRSGLTPAHLDPSVRALLERDAKVYIHQAGSTPCLSAIRRAQGIWLEDVAGRRFMDFHGNSCHHLGYAHPRLVAALKRQLDELCFTPRRYTDEPAVLLAEKLAAIWPAAPGKVLLAPSGSDAIEIALKLARVATARYKTISFYDSYHGSGFGAASLGGRYRDRSPRIGPLLPGTLHVPPFYRLPPHTGTADAEACAERSLEAMRFTFEQERDIAAVIAEPMRSTPHIPPDWYWPEVRALCDDYGALLVFDEIPTGLGKTGRLFTSEHFAVRPDITVLGKALGGGVVPIAAVIANPALDVAPELSLGHYTHEKNPFTARAALTTIEIIESEGLVENARRLGERALARLQDMARRHAVIGEVRGRGLLLAVEFDGASAEQARAMMLRALDKGLSLSTAEDRGVTLSPPLVITEEELQQALDILEAAISEEAGDTRR